MKRSTQVRVFFIDKETLSYRLTAYSEDPGVKCLVYLYSSAYSCRSLCVFAQGSTSLEESDTPAKARLRSSDSQPAGRDFEAVLAHPKLPAYLRMLIHCQSCTL